MKHIRTLNSVLYRHTVSGGCGECQTSCQSACKTSCTLANQNCEGSFYSPKEKTRVKNPKAV